MERTKKPKKEIKTMSDSQIRTLASTLVARSSLAAAMGTQYSGARDLYKALGYPSDTELGFADYYARYKRQDIAKAIIDRPAKATWQGVIELIESNEANDTTFEKAWKKLNLDLGLKSRLLRVDKLTGIGRYGVLLLGLDDVKETADFAKEVTPGKRKLLYVKPFSEDSAKIDTFEENTNNPRYGMPLTYTIQVVDMTMKSSVSVKVHHSRVVHITDDPLESEVYGTPRLEAVFNSLMDIDKVTGGDAEMFWRGARPGYSGDLEKDYQMTEETKTDLLNQVDEYENDLRRILITEGVKMNALAQQVADDPGAHLDIHIQKISSQTGIPKRILTGSERGELSSAQDSSEWKEYVQARREDHAEPHIIRIFVKRLIELKILPEPTEDYTVKWSDLYAQSEKARVDIGKARATALREYTYSPISQLLLPPDAFMEFCLGFNTEQITLVHEMRTKEVSEEELNAAILEKALNDGKEEEPTEETEEKTEE